MSHFLVVALGIAFAGMHVYAGEPSAQEIRRVLDAQVDAWNRGDVAGFMKTYAENCTFVSKTILHGRAQLQARYQTKYATRDAMGKVAFADIAIQQVDEKVAIVVGHWHLDRSAAAGGPAGGIFTLVFENIAGTWQIVLDHTA